MCTLSVSHQQARVVIALRHEVVVDSLKFGRDVVACHYFDRPHTIDTSVTDATSSAGVTVSMCIYAQVRASIISSVIFILRLVWNRPRDYRRGGLAVAISGC